MHNYESLAAEDLTAESADNVADYVIAAILHIIESEQVNSSVHKGLMAIVTALETANASPES